MNIPADRVAAHIACVTTLRGILASPVGADFKELGRSISARQVGSQVFELTLIRKSWRRYGYIQR